MSDTEYRLTTIDNPYSPFTQLTQWFTFDVEKGYNTCGLIARIADLGPDSTDEEISTRTKEAIDEIVKYDYRNIYKRVTKQQYTKAPPS